MTHPSDSGSFNLDAHVRALMAWHFDPETGSPYWLQRAVTLGFDPLHDVQGYEDLRRFPPVVDEWRSVAARDLIPRGCLGEFAVWETGGTTGPPRRIVDAKERALGLERIYQILNVHGFPTGDFGDWLHVGPSGPHLVGTNVRRLASLRGALCHTVDLDPRWVKRLYQAGRSDEARRYASHVVDQTVTVLRTQPIAVLTVTPPLLHALCESNEALSLLQSKIHGIIWFGTSMSDETLRFLEEEALPGVCLVGWYGNTLMGIACQRPRQAADRYRCIFTPPSPQAIVRLVDPAAPSRLVGYGEKGQVLLSVLNPEVLLPWHLERDQAVRVEPRAGEPEDGLAQVQPVTGAGPHVEGVY